MRELTVTIRFTKASLGSVKQDDEFFLPRSPSGRITFLASWHKANLRFASKVLNIHQSECENICWNIEIEGVPHESARYRRYYKTNNGKSRYSVHEAFFAGDLIAIHCVVPSTISDGDFSRLMSTAGQYKGLSPWKPGEFGFFEVVKIAPRLPTDLEN
jgi:hypothetical protein